MVPTVIGGRGSLLQAVVMSVIRGTKKYRSVGDPGKRVGKVSTTTFINLQHSELFLTIFKLRDNVFKRDTI